MFTDASGESRCIAAAAASREPCRNCTWLWTRARAQGQVRGLPHDKDDRQIGYQDLFAFVLAYQ
eukprot:8517773-Pyramimonas_sp.AAC.1